MVRLNYTLPNAAIIDSVSKCDIAIANAKTYISQVKNRKLELLAAEYPNDNSHLVMDVLAALELYEEIQSQIKNRNYRANRTRQGLKNWGVTEFVRRQVHKKSKPEGFMIMKKYGYSQQTCEYFVIKHKRLFDKKTVDLALAKI